MNNTHAGRDANEGRLIRSSNPSDNRIPFGLKDGRAIHVDQVARGLGCGCVCPACDGALIARHGDKNIHHFAHATDANCEGAYETSLHLAAKQVLEEEMHIVLPAATAKLNNNRAPIEFAPTLDHGIDSIELEKKLGMTIPDVTAIIAGNKLAIEIKVTHGIDDDKLARIVEEGTSTLEIDLSGLPRDIDKDQIRYHVVESVDRKAWIYNAYAAARLADLIRSGTKMPVIVRGMALHIDNCPKPARIFHGKRYANVMDDCLHCEFNLHVGGEYIVCCGALKSSRDSSRVVAIRRLPRLSRRTRRL